MNKKKLTKAKQKIVKTLVSVFVLAIVFAPSLLTVKWAIGVIGGNDSRKTVKVEASQTRLADKTAEPIRPFDQPLVSVTFDDGWGSVYTRALPVLQQNGIHTTQYVITDTFNQPSYMSVKQLKSMQSAGHEIAAHTITHPDLTMLDDKQLDHELSGSQQTITKDFGLTKDFTSPYGAYNAHTLSEISKYYRSQKNAEGDPAANALGNINIKSSFNALNLKSYSVRKSTTVYDLQKLLDEAKARNGWLILTYHQVDYSNEEYSVNPKDFADQMKFIGSDKTRSATVGQVLDSIAASQKRSN